MIPAVDALRIFGTPKQPPYFVLGIEDSEASLQRVYFHKIAVDQTYLIPVESGKETTYALNLINKGAAIIKPVCMDHTEQLLSKLGLALFDGAVWRYRPDFIVFWSRVADVSLQIRELRGFKKGEIADYDQLLTQKPEKYRNLKTRCPLVYDEADGVILPDPTLPPSPEHWPSSRWDCEFLGADPPR